MSARKSRLNPCTDKFRSNAEAMRTLIADRHKKVAQAARGGSEEARRKHLTRGKRLARDRVRSHLYYATARLWDDGVINPARAGARHFRLAQRPYRADRIRRV